MNDQGTKRISSPGMAESPPPEQSKCTCCGGVEFESGWVHHWGYYSYLRYTPWERFAIWRLGSSGWRVKSRRCLNCNQITFFCDPHPPLRFSLRTLLIATTLVAVVLGLVVWAAS